MTSQKLMKLFALIAIIAAFAAAQQWRTGDDDPAPWLIRLAIVAGAASFLLFVVNPQTRPRIMLQFLAALFATLALFAFAADFTAARSAAGHGFAATSVLQRLSDLAPTMVSATHNGIVNALGEAAWDPLLTTLLGMPAYIFFLILAGLAGYAGRHRRDVQIFIN